MKPLRGPFMLLLCALSSTRTAFLPSAPACRAPHALRAPPRAASIRLADDIVQPPSADERAALSKVHNRLPTGSARARLFFY